MNQQNIEEIDILDPSNIPLEGDFNTQVAQLMSAVRLTKEEVNQLCILFQDVTKALTTGSGWHNIQVQPFGSIVTGMGIKTSDVDCYITIPHGMAQHKIIFKAKGLLQRYHHLFTDLQPIPRAKVPILKFLHIPTQRQCDASFKNPNGVLNSKLVAFFLHVDPRILPLAIIIKYWAKVHGLTGTNFMSNYALTILVFYYLQTVDMLPSVYELQADLNPNDHVYVENWNMAFKEIYGERYTKNQDSLHKLLGGFFQFYSTFDFVGHVISVFLGVNLKKDLFKTLDTVPSPYKLYDQNVFNKLCRPLQLDTPICVQDPFDHSRNCTVAVSTKLFGQILGLLKNGANSYRELSEEDFLKAILTVSTAEQPKQVKKKKPELPDETPEQPKQGKTEKHELPSVPDYVNKESGNVIWLVRRIFGNSRRKEASKKKKRRYFDR